MDVVVVVVVVAVVVVAVVVVHAVVVQVVVFPPARLLGIGMRLVQSIEQ